MDAKPNAEAIEAWNTVLFEKFLRFRDLASEGFSVHGDAAMERLPFVPGLRILDIGCGFGDTTRELGRRVGTRGLAVGVDAAHRFIDVARHEATGLEQVRYRVADVQTNTLGGPYDIAFSRMGTMFFEQPVHAFRNIARALVPDGRLSIVVWRRREANQFVHLAETVVKSIVPPEPVIDAPTCGPGPFSMADPDVVSDQLQEAGFRDVTFRRFDAEVRIGKDLDEAVEFAMALGPAGEALRLAGDEGTRLRPMVVAALREALSRYVTPLGVRASSSTWNVTARRIAHVI